MVLQKKTLKSRRLKSYKSRKNKDGGGLVQMPTTCEESKLEEGSRKERELMKFLCVKHCNSKETACGGTDEVGEIIAPESVCLNLGVCPPRESLVDIPNSVMGLVKEFQELLENLTGTLKSSKKVKDTAKAEKLKALKKEIRELKQKYIKHTYYEECKKHLGTDIVSAKKNLLNLAKACKNKEQLNNITELQGCAQGFADIISRYDEILDTIKTEGLEVNANGTIRRILSKTASKIPGIKRPSIKEQLDQQCELTDEARKEKAEKEQENAEKEQEKAQKKAEKEQRKTEKAQKKAEKKEQKKAGKPINLMDSTH